MVQQGRSVKVGVCVQPDGGGVPSLVFTRYAIDRADITGAGGKVDSSKAKRARAVGVGVDAQTKRARDGEAWLAAEDVGDDTRAEVAAIRAEIAAGVLADQSVERSLLALCGGRAWAFGRGVPSMQGGGMGPRAARYVWRKRGVAPSSSSLEEASAAAVVAAWEVWTHLQAFDAGGAGKPPVFAAWVRVIAAHAWRAAFRSLKASARAVNGRHACGVASVPLADAGAAVDRESVAAWARVGDDGERDGRTHAAERFARRCAVDWLAGVLGAGRGGRSGQAARAQVTLLAWIICGADWQRAARAAGFANGKQAADSLRAGKVWQRLEVAAVSRQTERERQLVGALRVAGLAAGAAVKRQRAVANEPGWGAAVDARGRAVDKARYLARQLRGGWCSVVVDGRRKLQLRTDWKRLAWRAAQKGMFKAGNL